MQKSVKGKSHISILTTYQQHTHGNAVPMCDVLTHRFLLKTQAGQHPQAFLNKSVEEISAFDQNKINKTNRHRVHSIKLKILIEKDFTKLEKNIL